MKDCEVTFKKAYNVVSGRDVVEKLVTTGICSISRDKWSYMKFMDLKLEYVDDPIPMPKLEAVRGKDEGDEAVVSHGLKTPWRISWPPISRRSITCAWLWWGISRGGTGSSIFLGSSTPSARNSNIFKEETRKGWKLSRSSRAKCKAISKKMVGPKKKAKIIQIDDQEVVEDTVLIRRWGRCYD